MGLALAVGPANAGKVALLLERYLDALERDPVLIVPNRSDVDRVERDLLARRPALLSGSIGTFDDLFERLAAPDGEARPVAGAAQRWLLVRRAVSRTSLNGLGASAGFAGFADALSSSLAELDSGLLDPQALDGDVAALYAAYRQELDRVGLWDRGLLRRRAVERLAGDLGAWQGQPVFAYGFEDLTGAEWGLLEALAGRAEVHVSLPYEPGRAAFASLERTVTDLSRLADGDVEELPARFAEYAHPAIAHLERTLFRDDPAPGPALEGAVRFLEGAGVRATLELVGEEILALVEAGTAPDEIALVGPSLDRLRAPLETAFGSLGIPFAVEGRVRLGATPFGQALLSLLRFAWQGGGRRELYGFLRSPYSGLARANADFLEGRLRGRAVDDGERAEAETIRLRDGSPLGVLETVRAAATPVDAVRGLAASMLRAAHGLEAPPVGGAALGDLRAHDALLRTLDELDSWAELDELARRRGCWPRSTERRSGRARGRARPHRGARPDAGANAPLRGRVRAGAGAGQPAETAPPSPFLDDDARRDLDERRRARLQRPIRSAATATSSTRPARGRRAGSCSSGRRRPTRAARASRARSGRRRAPRSTPRRWRARRSGGRCPASPGRSSRRRPSESASAPWRRSTPSIAPARTRWRSRTAGSAGSVVPDSPSTGARSCDTRSCSRSWRSGRRSTSRSSSG